MTSAHSGFDEVWVALPDGQAMCALINGDLGWLMYLRTDADAGFSSRNPDYLGPPDSEIEYRLRNGQHDLHPASWAVPIAQIEKALDYFSREQRPPSFNSWHNDSAGIAHGGYQQ